ncbi:hypothetical protein [Candidatus Laterigemmans baculatus]|uniref:hypothetical protein n=1 Tax=Candidatus Laterigemmans baculatus TaxID=2770505 RepID=UPI0013DC5AF8|nr:hypothetical protein [Candidatus Laterigemmans baculatus]
MLSDYKVSRCTRRCAQLERALEPGEWYFSVVSEGDEEGALVRHDYSAEAWQGPPEGTLGWWKCRMPEAGAKKLTLAPDGVLVDLLRQTGEGTDPALRYLLALLLMRRRLIKPVDSPAGPPARSGSPATAGGLEVEVIADGSTIALEPCRIHPDQLPRLREQLSELLYCEAD